NLPARMEEEGTSSTSGSIFFAVRGGGAWMLASGDAAPERISAGASADPATARFCESVESGHSANGDSARIAERLGIGSPPVRLDSQAKYAVVARGEA